MLPIYLDVSTELRMIVCKNIRVIIDSFIDACEGLDYESFLQDIFPPHLIRRDFEYCKSIVLQLNEMVLDGFDRDEIAPVYEYVLYMILDWWIDVSLEDGIQSFEKDCSKTDELYLLDNLGNYEEYKSFMFQDWDFLYIAELFNCYRQSPVIFDEIIGINLDDYVELMPEDIEKEYELIKEHENTMVKMDDIDDETYIIKSIYSTIQRISLNPCLFRTLSEVDLSNYIADTLHQPFNEKGMAIEREKPGGFAKIQSGELDFFISRYRNSTHDLIAIGENKEWPKYEDSLKQLIGYMNEDTSFGFTIIFNKSTHLDTVLNRRKEILSKFNVNNKFKVIGEIQAVRDLKNVIKTVHENPEKERTYFNIYHFIVNIYRPDREIAAAQARRKK